jgi:hypothetical protein
MAKKKKSPKAQQRIMIDTPGNSTQTGQGVFNANLDLGTFSPTNRRRFVDGVAQPVPPLPILLQLQTTLTNGDTDTYKIQWQGATRTFTAAISGGSFELYKHSAVSAAPCYPDIIGGRCATLYTVRCRCFSIAQQQLVYKNTVIVGPIKDIGFNTINGNQGVYVRNEAGALAIAWAWNTSQAANPVIISATPLGGGANNCGNIPGYCPVYPGKLPKTASNTFSPFQLDPNDFFYAQISGNAGQATLTLT